MLPPFDFFARSRAGAEKGVTKKGPDAGRIDDSGAATKASRKPAVRASFFAKSKIACRARCAAFPSAQLFVAEVSGDRGRFAPLAAASNLGDK